MTISIVSASKQIEALMKAPPGKTVRGLQPAETRKIRQITSVILASDSLVDIQHNHPGWAVHRYSGNERTWSFSVAGATRLLMEWDSDRKEVSNIRFDNPH